MEYMKSSKLVLVCMLAALFFSVAAEPALAKKKAKDTELSTFTFENQAKFKPQNIKVLKKIWSAGLKSGSSKKRYYPEDSDPVVMDGTIYIGTHGQMFYAVSESDGKILWKFKNDEPIASSAAVTSDRVFFADLGGKLICLDRSSGTLIWSQQFDGEMLGQPLLAGNSLYVLKGEQEILSLSQTDGHMQWNKFIRTYIKSITMRGHATMVSDGSSLFVGLADGHLYRLDFNSGNILWDKNLNVPLRTFKDIDGAVVLDGDSLFVGGYFGAVYRLNKSTGQVIWSSDVATASSILLVSDVVVVSDVNGALVGINRQSGKQMWSNELNEQVLSEPVQIDGKVFVASYKSSAFLVDPANGAQIQKIAIGDGSINAPAVSGDRIYLLSNGASLVALQKI